MKRLSLRVLTILLYALAKAPVHCLHVSGLTPELLQRFSSVTTFQGKEITAESILGLMPQIPQDVNRSTQEFFEKNPDLVKAMSADDFFKGENPVARQMGEARYNYFNQLQERIASAGYKNSSVWNIVIKNNNQFLKAAGFPNRESNIRAQLGKAYGSPLSAQDYETFNTQHEGKTYQGVGRAAVYLRVTEAKRLFDLSINVPETYLAHIPGQPLDVCDANYIVVEKAIPGIVADLHKHSLALDQDIMRQMIIAIGYAGLWNHVGSKEGNIVVTCNPDTQEQQVYYHDLEPPNFHRNPTNFFNKDRDKFVANIKHGWAAYTSEIIEPYSQQVEKDIDAANATDHQKMLFKQLLHNRVETLLVQKAEIEKQITPYLPK